MTLERSFPEISAERKPQLGQAIVKSFIKRHKAPAIAFVQLLPRQVRCIRVNNIVKSLFHEKSLKNRNMEASSCHSEAEHCFHFPISRCTYGMLFLQLLISFLGKI